MFRLRRVEFVLPGYEVADGGDDESDGHKPPVAVSNTEARSVSSDYSDNDDRNVRLEELTKAIQYLTSERQILLKAILEDVKEGKSDFEFNHKTGKVIVKDISETSRFASRIPENTLKVAPMAGKTDDDKDFEINQICRLVDQLKYKRSSSGVALSNKMGISSSKSYEEGQQYKLLEDMILGEGLNATVTVIKDMKTDEHIATKKVYLHNFNSNEVRAMYDLREAGICPELYGMKLDSPSFIIYMEIVNNSITVKAAIEQLAGTKAESFNTALFVLTELMKALDVMHNQHEWYHQDLHSANVLVQKVQSHENQWRIRIIDFGNAKQLADLKKNENFLKSICLDLQSVLRQFCALALQGEWFEHIHDFKENYESRVDEYAEPGEIKNQIKEIIKEGLAVTFQKERNFIEFLKTKCNTVVSEDITTGLKCLSLDRKENPELDADFPGFADLHDQSKSKSK